MFPEVPILFRVLCGNPESRQSTVSGTRNGGRLTGNVGRSRAARCFSQNSFPSDQQLTRKRGQLRKFLLVSLDLHLLNKFSSILQFLGNLLLDVLGRVFSLLSFLHASLSCLVEPDQPN